MIQPERVQELNNRGESSRGGYVLYWMQQSQRPRWNHALEFAVERGNALSLPVVVVFGLMDDYPEANLRHYTFMMQGLAQTRASLAGRGIRMIVRHEAPDRAALALAAGAALVVADRGYLRMQKAWRLHVARAAPCRVVQVESDVVVPVEVVSDKEEFAARTIRPKIHRHLDRFLVPLRERAVKRSSLATALPEDRTIDISDPAKAIARMKVDRCVEAVRDLHGGPDEAAKMLTAFVNRKLAHYAERRNEPSVDGVSHMSPYLHFGQVSPLEIALAARGVDAPEESRDAFLEELIVRRELSMNFTHYCAKYDEYGCLPPWARQTLAVHERDARPTLYTRAQLESAKTHDPYWNAAQTEMTATGKMHNYMRMYWGKKILEWTASPREAFETALYLNNRYELDGRDANSFAGVAWVFGKHDRPWGERPIFGTVRYMNAAGLERKLDIDAYVKKVAGIAGGLLF